MDRVKRFILNTDKGILIKAGIACIIITALILYIFYEDKTSGSSLVPEENTSEWEVTGSSDEAAAEEIKVDIKGEVAYPGVYTASSDQRVEEIINEAGGITAEAAVDQVNLAQRVHDEMVIHVPSSVEEEAQEPDAEGNSGPAVNMNQAEKEEWESLPGIGPAKAEAIIQYREENGPFQKKEDIINVPGIGEKTFESLQDLLSTY
ncbi:helix-hairpin-helix domain-containing protein [Alkalicoccus halolimnae]|uniref:Helix-hairpin-helix domain-containing protein n=1 Tax=Alkalicoccus halolimnae TaxID=1667239 RepID=A0A5C7F6X1_9BACI|nr:helix-hairpin-helix domain-containing protein [Alkalicoccus halolimnae]TXF86461.1 ComEA family DNA-binding protein [Alkalicoccus halolimnae]